MRETLEWASSADDETMAVLERAEDWLTENGYFFSAREREAVLLAMVGFFAKENREYSKALLAELGTVP